MKTWVHDVWDVFFFWELHQFGGHSQCSAHTAGCLDREMLLALPQCQEISEVAVMLWAPSWVACLAWRAFTFALEHFSQGKTTELQLWFCGSLWLPAVIPAVSVPALVPDLSRGQMNVAVKTTACSGECEAACCFTASEKGGNSTRQSSQIWAFPGRHAMYPATSLPPQRGSCKLSVTKLPSVTPHFPGSIGSTLITFSIHGSKEDHNIKSCPFKSLPSNLSQHYGLVINSALHSECHLPSSKRWNGRRTGRGKGNNHRATLTTVNVNKMQQPCWMLKTTKVNAEQGWALQRGERTTDTAHDFAPTMSSLSSWGKTAP